jgi:hypothetical protein
MTKSNAWQKEVRAFVALERATDNQAHQGYAVLAAASAELLTSGMAWKDARVAISESYAASGGTSPDNLKRFASRAYTMLAREEHPGYVPGFLAAAAQGGQKAQAYLCSYVSSTAGKLSTGYAVIKHTTKPGGNTDFSPDKRVLPALTKMMGDRSGPLRIAKILAQLEAASPGALVLIDNARDVLAQQAAKRLASTNAAPKAQVKRKSHVGKPLVLGGGSANAAKPHKAIKSASNGEAHTA